MDYHKEKAVVSQKAIIVNTENQILLLQRPANDISRPGGWDFPGGTLQEMEDPVAGLRREVKEETGLDIITVRPIATLSFPLHDNCWTVLIVYTTSVTENTVTISDEHQHFSWMTKEEILALSMPKKYLDIISSL